MLAIHAAPIAVPRPLPDQGTDHFIELDCFGLDDGTVIPRPRIALRVTGNRSGPVILVLGGISARRFVGGDDVCGWWDTLTGTGRPLDTKRLCILSADYLGAGDSTHPPAPDAWTISARDQARVLETAIRALGIDQLAGVVGCSYGGSVALALGERSPEFVQSICVVCASHRPAVRTTAYRAVQREIVRLGLAGGQGRAAIDVARRLAMIGFRTGTELDARFAAKGLVDSEATENRDHVQSYLAAKGTAYANSVSPATFLCLSQSCDLACIEPERLPCPVWIGAAETDEIVPLDDVIELASRLPDCRAIRTVSSVTGHDAFLTEHRFVADLLTHFVRCAASEVAS